VDEELIRWCVLATRAACSRMTAPHLKALQDSVGQVRSLPARFAWDHKATAHAQIFNLLADVITDRPVPAVLLDRAVGAMHDLMITVGRVIATGDVVTALFKAEGTQAADYAGAINQEKHLDIDQAWRFTVTGGVITGVSAYWCQQQVYRRLAVKRFDAIAIA